MVTLLGYNFCRFTDRVHAQPHDEEISHGAIHIVPGSYSADTLLPEKVPH